jgi:amino acid adenylation domain-containing protein
MLTDHAGTDHAASRDTPEAVFERIADIMPGVPAIDTGSAEVTYAQLRDLVHRVTTRLAELELAPNSRIGLAAAPGLATYAAYLAILRLGHAVVPFGLSNPLAFQLSVASRAGLAAAFAGPESAGLAAALRESGIAVMDPDAAMRSAAGRVPDPVHDPESLAYILFTSGSTGQPKGVPIKNRNVAAYLAEVGPGHALGPGSRLSHTFALTFDPSVFDILGALTTGSCLVLPRKRELLSPAFYVTSRRLTHWYSVPSLISYALRIGAIKAGSMPQLRHSMFIGEPLPVPLATAWRQAAPGSTLENVYGPTEVTVSCASWVLPGEPADWPATANQTVPVGTVYPSMEWFLWDGVGQGSREKGELCVRGPLRFDGYLDPADNAGRFLRPVDGRAEIVADGSSPAPQDWYRTGDRVQVADTAAGPALVHLGRIDRQVKVNGYRIELGDVEGALRSLRRVIEAAVLAVSASDGEASYLHAFVNGEPDDADVVRCLSEMLPPYMIPARLTWLSELPRNQSGKIDYVRLAAVARDG